MLVTPLRLTQSQQAQASAIAANNISVATAANNIGDTISIQLKGNAIQTTFDLPNKGTPILGTFTQTPNITPINFAFTSPNIITDVQPNQYSDPPISTKSLLLFFATFSASKALGVEKTYQFYIVKDFGGLTEYTEFSQPITYFNAPENQVIFALIKSENAAQYRFYVKNVNDTTGITVTDCNLMVTRLNVY